MNRNYNVIIIDDDKDNANKISKMINYNEKSFDCIASFSNGNDALDFIEKSDDEVDVVISDIEMPYIDGFQLASKIKEKHKDISIILMMSYNAYEYAKKALDLNIEGLIKKPIQSQDLSNALKKIYDNLVNNKIKDNKLSELKEYQEDSLQIVKDSILYSLVKTSNKEMLTNSKLKEVNIDLNYKEVIVTCLEVERSNTSYDVDVILPEIRQIVNNTLSYSNNFDVFRVYEKIYTLIKLDNVNSTILTHIDSCFVDIIKTINKELNVNVSIGFSSLNKMEDLTKAYKQAKQAINYCSFKGNNKIYYYDEHVNVNSRPITSIELERLDQLITFGDINELSDCLDSIKEVVKSITNINDYYLIVTRVTYHILNKAENLHAIYDKFGENGDFYHHLLDNNDVDSLFNTLKEICAFIKEDNVEIFQNNSQQNIKRVLNYIESNYSAQNLSLETVAESVNLSVSYVCYLLKKEKNTSFVKYITDLRINKAKKLLKTTNEKIGDIATQVGYSDAYYFSHNFKKVCGISPKDYRNNS